MPPTLEPEDWSDADWANKEFVDYALEPHQKTTIRAIKKNVSEHAYTSRRDVNAHLELLEDLSNLLHDVLNNEHRAGKENWDVEKAYKQIKVLYRELSHELDRLNR